MRVFNNAKYEPDARNICNESLLQGRLQPLAKAYIDKSRKRNMKEWYFHLNATLCIHHHLHDQLAALNVYIQPREKVEILWEFETLKGIRRIRF